MFIINVFNEKEIQDSKSYLINAEKPQHIEFAGAKIDGQLALICVDRNGQIKIIEVAR